MSWREAPLTMTHRLRPGLRLKRLFASAPPVVLAVFSYRYDAHLVRDLLVNLEPLVDGWIAYDDRGSATLFSDERERRRSLIAKARELGAGWVLAVDPDERFETGVADRMRDMTSGAEPVVWGFHLREMYSPTCYRIDGVWGQKVQWRLFPLFEGQTFPELALHQQWHFVHLPFCISIPI